MNTGQTTVGTNFAVTGLTVSTVSTSAPNLAAESQHR
jgi:hypothetical protein